MALVVGNVQKQNGVETQGCASRPVLTADTGSDTVVEA